MLLSTLPDLKSVTIFNLALRLAAPLICVHFYKKIPIYLIHHLSSMLALAIMFTN